MQKVSLIMCGAFGVTKQMGQKMVQIFKETFPIGAAPSPLPNLSSKPQETELVKFGPIDMLFGLILQVFGVKESIFGVKKTKI